MRRCLHVAALAAATVVLSSCFLPLAVSYGAVFPEETDETGTELTWAMRVTPQTWDLPFGFDMHYQRLHLSDSSALPQTPLEPRLLGINAFWEPFRPIYVLAGVDIATKQATLGWEAGAGLELGRHDAFGERYYALFGEGGWTSLTLKEDLGGETLSWPFARVGVLVFW